MTAGPLATDIVAAFLLASVILYRYGDCYRQHVIVTLAVLIAWSFSFLIIFVLPLDVSSAVYKQCREKYNESLANASGITNASSVLSPCLPPWSAVPDNTFPSLWRVVYWSSQFLTWFIMPLMQSYTQAGEFTVTGKLRSAAIDNAIYYGTYLLIAGILLIYIATKPGVVLDWLHLKAIASSASNTWGLFLLVLLLGHGLVEIPRSLWNHSKHGYALRYAYFQVAKTANEKSEAEYEISNVIESLREILGAVHVDHPFYRYVQEIRQSLPVEINNKLSIVPRNTDEVPSERSLALLHKQLKKALQKLHRTDAQYNAIVTKTVLLEDIDRNILSHNRRFKATFPSQRSPLLQIFWSPTIEWYYRCAVHRWLLRSLSVVSAVLSVAVVWSEVTFFNEKPVLSLFAVFLNMSIERYDYYAMELTSTAIIGYLCYCAYSTVLKIKFLNKYYITSNHQTDEFSLIFSGMMACRLTPAMCLNFLGMIHMDSHIIKTFHLETAYTRIMGHMDVVSIVSDGFNVYFPMLVLLLCLASYFSLGSRLLSKMGFPQFVGDELTQEWVDDGKAHISREKRLRQRMEETAAKRRELENYAGGGVGGVGGGDGENRGRVRYQREPDRVHTSHEEYSDPAKTSLLSDVDQCEYYVQPPRTAGRDSSQQPFSSYRATDRAGRLPSNFFDDV